MRKLLLMLWIIVLVSCSTAYKYRNWLEYKFPIPKKDEHILKYEIENVKKVYPFVYIMLNQTDEGFKVYIIPSRDLKKSTNSFLKVENSYRYIRIDDNYYPLVFWLDQRFGGLRSKEVFPSGEIVMSYMRRVGFSEHANVLYFDKKWNYLKKESLLKYDLIEKKPKKRKKKR
ncbi:hypothetical protein HW49_04310 [Porphyromonadaceae bacterium COT-184 OH4590]|nr:hypothetical protein HW49_04310 [Porphyromonadaceae bacterium COT-184 OH4590]